MIEESDWHAAYRRLLAEGRERLGDPPTPEEVEALLDGQLAEEEAARIRTLLAYYPEIARVMIEPPPEEDVTVLTEEEQAADLAAIRRRLGLPVAIPARRFQPALAYAAALIVVAGAATFIYVQTKRPTPPRNEPVRVTATNPIDLWPDAVSRGTEPSTSATLHATAGPFVLRLLTNDDRRYDAYRLDVARADAAEPVIWSRSALVESPGGSFDVTVPTTVLAPGGRYRLILYGVHGANAGRVATYTVVVLGK